MSKIPSYERLSRLDAAFLSFEGENSPMHVALTLLFRKGPLEQSNGGVDVEMIRNHVAARLSRVPRYRQKLAKLPFVGDSLWVDDQDFDIAYHVRHTSVPQPGDEAKLKERCAEIYERPLNRARPLWEIWIVEGLADGNFALLCKVHHCMVDGVGGMAMLSALLSTDPVEPSGVMDGWQPRPEPNDRELLVNAIRRRRVLVAGAKDTVLSAALRPGKTTEAVRQHARAFFEFAKRGLRLPPTLSFNRPIGPNRAIDWLSLDLARTRNIGTRLAATVNDVALATVAGGFRRFLEGRGQLGDSADIRTIVPVNVRSAGDEGQLGNQASCWFIDLPIDQQDPRETLRRVHAQTVAHKSHRSALGGEMLAQAAEWANASLVHAIVRAVKVVHPYNLVITNVPGPAKPLYLGGAPLLTAHPHLPLFEAQGISIAIFRYTDRLQIGLTADRDQVPDLIELRRSIDQSFEALALTALHDTRKPEGQRAMAAAAGKR